MRPWEHMYIGRRAKALNAAVSGFADPESRVPGLYFITFSVTPGRLFEIHPSLLLRDGGRLPEDTLIVGLAFGYGEALTLVRDMVGDMYRESGGFDWRAYMALKDKEAG